MTDGRVSAATLPALLAIAACGPVADVADGIDADAVPRYQLVEDLPIGSVDDPEAGFSRIGGVALDRDGDVFVSELSGVTIPTFNESPYTITVRPRAMREDGLFSSTYTLSRGSPLAPGDSAAYEIPKLVFDAFGAVVDTAGTWTIVRRGSRPDIEQMMVGDLSLPKPNSPSDEPFRQALDDGELIIDRTAATAAGYAIFTATRTDVDGDTLFHDRFRYAAREYAGAATDTLVAGLVGTYTGMGGNLSVSGGLVVVMRPTPGVEIDTAAVESAIRDALVLPTYQPPVTTYRLGQDGSYWLRREEEGTREFRWLVLNEDSSPRGEIRVPRDLAIEWSDEQQVWAVERDELDVPWLVRYRIVEARGG